MRHPLQWIVSFGVAIGCVLVAGLAVADPYPASSVISEIIFDWTTHRREAPGSDNWPMTWSDDDHQYTSWGDGGGFGGTNSDGRSSLGVGRIEGEPDAYTGFNVFGGKNPENPATFAGKSYGILSVAGTLYMWVSPGSGPTGYERATLYSSTNKGATWQAASWSVVEADGVAFPTILQFGRDYAGARDGFVYSYFIEIKNSSALAVQIPGEITLARVPSDQIMNESSYEWFSGTPTNPTWDSNIAKRVPVLEDGDGVGWNLSVSHNEGLDRYFLMTEHTQTSQSNLGIFDAPEPWGPWTTVLYEDGWDDAGASPVGLDQTGFFWNFANKWVRGGGVDFTLVFTGIQSNDSFNTVDGTIALPEPAPAVLGASVLMTLAILSRFRVRRPRG
jgi:hypothetical protein